MAAWRRTLLHSRSNRNLDGTLKLDRNVPLEEAMRDETDRPPVILNGQQRKAVHAAIKELCDRRRYALHALNVRTNHVHGVIGVQAKPERVADSLKAASTRRLRELALIAPDHEFGLAAGVDVISGSRECRSCCKLRDLLSGRYKL